MIITFYELSLHFQIKTKEVKQADKNIFKENVNYKLKQQKSS